MAKTHLRRDEKHTHCGREITAKTKLAEPSDEPSNECHWCRITYESTRRHR